MTKTTHHKLILWLPLLFMAFYTSVQINKIHTTAQTNYNSMSIGVSATHSTSPDKAKDNGIKPNIGLPQDVDKQSITHTAINENTTITITDKKNQTQDITKISTDTDNASFTMTEINTEVLDIRADISKELSEDGFKAVGDLAMKEGWEDGSIEKTLAHAAMGAVVAGVGNGDAISGALGAGAAEMARPATADANDATQQTVSALIGAVAGGGTGASTGLDGEKFNRQLHQREIAWIEANAEAFAQANNLSPEQAQALLTLGALGMVDATENAEIQHMIRSGMLTQEQVTNAQEYIKGNVIGETFNNQNHQNDTFDTKQQMFTVDNEQYFDRNYDPNTPKGLIDVTLDVIPISRGLGLGLGKVGTKIPKSDFYVNSNGDIIPSTGYRAVSGPGAEAAQKGDLMSPNGDTYFTFDNPSGKSSTQIKSELQLHPSTNPTHYGEFDTLQIIDDVKIPKEDWNRGIKPEPTTSYFGENHPDGKNYGTGGATQAVTKIPIKDFELQEIKK